MFGAQNVYRGVFNDNIKYTFIYIDTFRRISLKRNSTWIEKSLLFSPCYLAVTILMALKALESSMLCKYWKYLIHSIRLGNSRNGPVMLTSCMLSKRTQHVRYYNNYQTRIKSVFTNSTSVIKTIGTSQTISQRNK